MKAMILAAGLGTRLKPLTINKPKALIELNGLTLLERTIKIISKLGVTEIIINVHHFADQIKKFLIQKNFLGLKIYISDESAELLDTGGALKKAAHFFSDGEPFLLHNVDVFTDLNLSKLQEFHLRNNSIATLAVMSRQSSRQFLFDDQLQLCGWKNYKTNEVKVSKNSTHKLKEYAFCGIQIINPAIFDYFPSEDKFSLIDFYLTVCKSQSIKAFIDESNYFFDLGSAAQLNLAKKFLLGKNQ